MDIAEILYRIKDKFRLPTNPLQITGCVTQIIIMFRLTIEEQGSIKTENRYLLLFIEFNKAFDSAKIVVENIGKKDKNDVHTFNVANCLRQKKSGFRKRGVKQGCVLRSLLFNICLDDIMSITIKKRNGTGWNHLLFRKLVHFNSADDQFLTASWI